VAEKRKNAPTQEGQVFHFRFGPWTDLGSRMQSFITSYSDQTTSGLSEQGEKRKNVD